MNAALAATGAFRLLNMAAALVRALRVDAVVEDLRGARPDRRLCRLRTGGRGPRGPWPTGFHGLLNEQRGTVEGDARGLDAPANARSSPCMSDAGRAREARLALAGYDGSAPAPGAIESGARLLPSLTARVIHLWALAAAGWGRSAAHPSKLRRGGVSSSLGWPRSSARRSAALRCADLIKPSRRELRGLTGDGQSLGRFDHQRAVREAVEQEARAVVVSLGPGGAFLAAADGVELHVPSPDVDVVGCVGGGDSVVAGNALD